MTALNRWLIALLLTAAAVAVCYLWVDRPLALLAHTYNAHRETFARLTHIPDLLNPFAAIAFVIFGLWVLAGRPVTRIVAAVGCSSISLIVAEATREPAQIRLRPLFADTWVQNNPSLIPRQRLRL